MKIFFRLILFLSCILLVSCQVKRGGNTGIISGHLPVTDGFTLSISSGTYGDGETLNFELTHGSAVTVTGTPELSLTIGGTPRTASYVSGSGTDTLTFTYTVVGGDNDADGISVATPINMNGGSITFGTSTSVGNIYLPSLTSVLVDTISPTVTSVTAPVDGSYSSGQQLNFIASFSEAVFVTGSPRIALTIGMNTRYATFVSGSGTANLLFRYTLTGADDDADGIAIAGIIDLNGGVIADAAPNNAVLTFAAPDTSGVIVGSQITITSIDLPLNDEYELGEVLTFTAHFSEAVVVTLIPRLRITLGSGVVYANYASGGGTSDLVFTYTVQSGDLDSNGIVLESPMELNGGAIQDVTLIRNANLIFTSGNTTGITVDGISSAVASVTLPVDDTYAIAENLDFTVNFTSAVTITGTPRLVLAIGGTTRYANYVSGSGGTAILFRHTVLEGDVDADGVTLQNDVALNGGTILEGSGDAALLTFTGGTYPAKLVDGIRPLVSSSIVSPDDTYIESEFVDFTVSFSEVVNVTGTPRLTLTVGAATKYATYQSGTGTDDLLFRYTVEPGDSDNDGISASAVIDLNSGSINDPAGNALTDLSWTPPVLTGVLVNGIAPTIVSITPPPDDVYSSTEILEYTVVFSEAITVTGTPGLTLQIGGQSRTAVYVSGTGTTDLLFRYTVVLSDDDADGVTTVSPMVLSGGTLRNSVGGNANLTFTGDTEPGVIVANGPVITSVTAPANGNYDRTTSPSVSFTVNFSELVNVVGTPRLTLNVGGETKYANYASGTGSSVLIFTYTISGADLDLNGISVSSPMDLNGWTIKNALTLDAYLTFTAPNTSGILVTYPDLVAWYDAQDIGTLFQNSACTTPVTADAQSVGCLRDKSGKSNHALQATAGLLPSYRTSGVQALPSLRFDGVDDMMSALDHPDFNNMSGLTAIVVFVPLTLDAQPRALVSKRVDQTSITFSMFLFSSNYMFMDVTNSTNRQNNTTAFAITNPYLATMHFDGSLAAASRTKFYMDGLLNATRNSSFATAQTTTGKFHIGSLNENYGLNKTFHGFIGEVIFFRRSLGTTAGGELEKIHQYLEAKWSL